MPNYPMSTPAYFMPSVSTYPGYPGMYFNNQNTPQQSFAPSPAPVPNNQGGGVIWVDGEQAARSYQLPAGWPANTPFALWDSNDRVIYWKSINQLGAPNPLIKIPYQWDDAQQNRQVLPVSGTVSEASATDNLATKDEVNRLKEEIMGLKDMLVNRMPMMQANQNGSNNGQNQNRGGNK